MDPFEDELLYGKATVTSNKEQIDDNTKKGLDVDEIAPTILSSTKETTFSDSDFENEEDENIEIVLPTKEELEARRAVQQQQQQAGTSLLGMKLANRYVKPGLATSSKQDAAGGMAATTTTSGVNLDLVAQYEGKDLFEVDLDSLEDKPWRRPGADITDYFNYGFSEQTWRQYTQKQLRLRLEYTMQRKIGVYDHQQQQQQQQQPQQHHRKIDLPPELKALTAAQPDDAPAITLVAASTAATSQRNRSNNYSRQHDYQQQHQQPYHYQQQQQQHHPSYNDNNGNHYHDSSDDSIRVLTSAKNDYQRPPSNYPPRKRSRSPTYDRGRRR